MLKKQLVLAAAAVLLSVPAAFAQPAKAAPAAEKSKAAAKGQAADAKKMEIELVGSDGKKVGSATLEGTPDGVIIFVDAKIPPGTHAIHIHEKGDCSAADATSAGGHFNPHGNPHGRAGHGAHHGGDMDNIVANAEGVARVDVHALGVVLGGGAPNDALGKAVIVHGGADDYTSQPTGDAGNRIACGIIRAQ